MMQILKTNKLTKDKWLNLVRVKLRNAKGKIINWTFVSRQKHPLRIPRKVADAVVVVAFRDDKMVLIKQYRPAIGGYIIEHVAGLIDKHDTILDAARRELKEETGLDYVGGRVYGDFLYNSVGITDECVSYVFATVIGEPTNEFNEDTEDIEVIFVDREEASKLLCDSEVAFSAKCWLILQAYIKGFDWLKGK